MKIFPVLIAAALCQAATVAGAVTVHSAASYQFFGFAPSPGVSYQLLPPEGFEDNTKDGTGTASTSFQSKSVTADAATGGRSNVPMDYGTAQVISRDRITLSNTATWLGTFGGHILPNLEVSITGNNDGQSLPGGLYGELATATAALNIFVTIFRPDGSEVQSTIFNGTLGLGFGGTGTKQGTGGGINGLSFASSLHPGESAELVFELSAFSNAWHADPLETPGASPVPLPAGIVLLPGGLAMLFGWRRRSAGAAPRRD